MSIYRRLLAHPFVYDRVRPFVVGGIDWSPLYRNLEAGPEDVILDVGCGTGIAQEYLSGFAAYYGFDTDPGAIQFAKAKPAGANVHYECARLSEGDIVRIRPTRIILSGLLHHLSDEAALELLRMCASAPDLKRIATSDVVYLPRQPISNLLAYFDRGQFVRRQEDYLNLMRQAGLNIVRADVVRCHPANGKALYLMTALEPCQSNGP